MARTDVKNPDRAKALEPWRNAFGRILRSIAAVERLDTGR
jgi:hypothetical protein